MSNIEDKEISSYADIPAVAIQVSRNIVVASIQVELDDDVLARFREDLLRCIHEMDSRGVILDLSGLETLDSHEFAGLRSIISMSSIMGAQSILVGMRPGVVSALIEVGADVDGLLSAIDLDAAYAILAPEPEPEPETVERLESAGGVQNELTHDPGEGK
jgi:rsbT antagonist protein RsbS